MWRLILVTFGFLGWSFYELSGGADYEPVSGSRQFVSAEEIKAADLTKTSGEPVVATQSGPAQIVAFPVATTGAVSNARIQVTLASAETPVRPQKSFKNFEVNLTKAELLAVATPNPDLPKAAMAPAKEPKKDLRAVRGSRVNMRMGPGTNFSIIDKLVRGTEVEVLRDNGKGWLKLRTVDSQRIGWMSADLVTRPAQDG